MEKYAVKNIYGVKGAAAVRVPGSKSITNRALLIAALAQGSSVLDGVLFSDDSENFIKCIQDLGINVEIDRKNFIVKIDGTGGKLPVNEAEINVGSAGTAARFLTAFLSMCKGTFRLNSSEQMEKRPMEPLIKAVESMGAEVICHKQEGHFPFTLKGTEPYKTDVEIDIDKSSQFLSAFLISSCLCKKGINIHVKGAHGMNYIKITTNMMRDFGIISENPMPNLFTVAPNSFYTGRNYAIEADASAAGYFYAMAAVLGVKITVKNIFFSSVQGDVELVRALENMGCAVSEEEEGISVTGPKDGRLKGVDVDMSGFSDQALTLAAIAPYAEGPVRIRGISHIRGQECDRINAIVKNLSQIGVKAEETGDGVIIYPGSPKSGEIETYEDHRVAMAFAVTGLRADGIVIKNPLCCKKTFANYFDVLEQTIAQLKQ